MTAAKEGVLLADAAEANLGYTEEKERTKTLGIEDGVVKSATSEERSREIQEEGFTDPQRQSESFGTADCEDSGGVEGAEVSDCTKRLLDWIDRRKF